MTAHCTIPYAIPFVVISDAEHVRNILCGKPQQNEHCKGWRWHLYTKRDFDRMNNVWGELAKMRAERLAREEALS